MSERERGAGSSCDNAGLRRERLKEIFPEAFVGDKIDFEKLKEALGEISEYTRERYSLTWAGKAEALRALQAPSRAALVPCPEASIDFDAAEHIFIEGENLETLKLLLRPYGGKIKMIYIDPPYNKGKEFIYNDNYREPLRSCPRLSGLVDKEGAPFIENLETSDRLHSKWLSMMYPRLILARELLRDDGAIFVSIDENEIHNLRIIMNEVFGEENFVNILHVKRAAKNVNQQFKRLKKLNLGIEYVLVYQKSDAFMWVNPYREASKKRKRGYWTSFYNNADRPTMRYELLGVRITEGQWKWERGRALRAVENYREFREKYPAKNEEEELRYLKKYWLETGGVKEFIKLRNGRPHYWVKPSENQLRTTDWTDIYINDNRGKEKYGFDTAKNIKAVKTFIYSVTAGDGDIIMDFFAGSGTTGEATMQLNREDGGGRKFICIQMPELLKKPLKLGGGVEVKTISEICLHRLSECAREYGAGLKVFKLTGQI